MTYSWMNRGANSAKVGIAGGAGLSSLVSGGGSAMA